MAGQLSLPLSTSIDVQTMHLSY